MTDLHPESTKDNPIAELCEPVGVSKQAYYQYDEDIAIAKAIREDLPRSSIGSICLCRICYWYRRIVLSFIKMDVILYTLFIGLILFSLKPSLTLKNISKRKHYLTLCSDIALMMLGFYWKQKGLFFLIISFFVFLAAFFLIYYFRCYLS